MRDNNNAMEKKKKIKLGGDQRGTNPNSLAALNKGSEPKYGERKTTLTATVTPTSKEHLKLLAQLWNCDGVSDLIERIGQGEIVLTKPDTVA